jgi:hypothetical protein
MNNNPYLTAVQEIKKGCGKRYCPSCNVYIKEEDYDEYAFHCGLGEGQLLLLCPECDAKLKTAVKFLQMTKDLFESLWKKDIFDVDDFRRSINSALKEAEENKKEMGK